MRGWTSLISKTVLTPMSSHIRLLEIRRRFTHPQSLGVYLSLNQGYTGVANAPGKAEPDFLLVRGVHLSSGDLLPFSARTRCLRRSKYG